MIMTLSPSCHETAEMVMHQTITMLQVNISFQMMPLSRIGTSAVFAGSDGRIKVQCQRVTSISLLLSHVSDRLCKKHILPVQSLYHVTIYPSALSTFINFSYVLIPHFLHSTVINHGDYCMSFTICYEILKNCCILS